MSAPPPKKPRLTPLPHFRADCPSNVFHPSVHDTSHRRNLSACSQCYCLVCDKPSLDCTVWPVHCMAYYTHPDWYALRTAKRVTADVKVPAALLPSCVVTESKYAPVLHVLDVAPGNLGRARVCAPKVRDFIDLEDDGDVQINEGEQLASAAKTNATRQSAPERETAVKTEPQAQTSAGVGKVSSAGAADGFKDLPVETTSATDSQSDAREDTPVVTAVADSRVTAPEDIHVEVTGATDSVAAGKDEAIVATVAVEKSASVRNDHSPSRVEMTSVMDDGVASDAQKASSDMEIGPDLQASMGKAVRKSKRAAALPRSEVRVKEETYVTPRRFDTAGPSKLRVEKSPDGDKKSRLAVSRDIASVRSVAHNVKVEDGASSRAWGSSGPGASGRRSIVSKAQSKRSAFARNALARRFNSWQSKLKQVSTDGSSSESKHNIMDTSDQEGSPDSSDQEDLPDHSDHDGFQYDPFTMFDFSAPHEGFEYHGMLAGLYSSVASPEASQQEMKELRQFWAIDRMLPAPHIEKKRLLRPPTAEPIARSFPKRVLIGFVDMWRPYCSHMTARNIDLPVGKSSKDIASISSGTDVRVAGMKTHQVVVMAREMGIDLRNPTLLDPVCSGYPSLFDGDLDGLQAFNGKSSFAWEDGSEMPTDVPEAIRACIDRGQIEVKWELTHCTTSENKEKAFASHHVHFGKLDCATRREEFRKQLKWLEKCDARLSGVEKLDCSNCCLLRAWIYLTPEAFRSNMVSAAHFCPLDSPQAHMDTIDGGGALGMKLSNRYDGQPWTREKIAPPSLAKTKVEEMEKKWSELELSAHESDRTYLKTIIAVLRCLENGYAVSLDQAQTGQSHPTVLAAQMAGCATTFETLTQTHRANTDNANTSEADKLTDILRDVSNQDEGETDNKASIPAVLSSTSFTVSDGYRKVEDQPPEISLTLRRYQLESLAWMLDQENKGSVSDPFWVRIRGSTVDGTALDVFYCPMTGSVSRFAPPAVVGGVLAEEMGLGKTVICVSLILRTLRRARETFQSRTDCRKDLVPSHATLIVCPVSLLKQWEKELRDNVSSSFRILSWYGPRTSSPAEIASYDVVLTTYGILANGFHNALLRVHWFRVIIDESTYLKGGGSACDNKFMDLISSRRWAVSGTPFGDNFKRNFISTVRFIGVAPFSNTSSFNTLSSVFTEPLGDPEFPTRYAVPQFAYVMKNIMMRHIKTQKLHGQALVELPPATGRCVNIDLDEDEKVEYDDLEAKVKLQANRFLCNQKRFGRHFVELASLARPLRIKADGVEPSELRKPKSKVKREGGVDSEAEVLPSTSSTRRVGAKVKQLLRDVSAHREQDCASKFVVFTEFNGVKEQIRRHLQGNGFDVLTLDGAMTAGRRGRIIKQFAEDQDAAVLVLSLAAGACGLTLTMANFVVLFEVGLKMATELQAVNRIHRIGQTRPVETLTYVAKGTIDERIVEVRRLQGKPRVVGEEVEGNSEELSTLEVYRTIFGYEG